MRNSGEKPDNRDVCRWKGRGEVRPRGKCDRWTRNAGEVVGGGEDKVGINCTNQVCNRVNKYEGAQNTNAFHKKGTRKGGYQQKVVVVTSSRKRGNNDGRG